MSGLKHHLRCLRSPRVRIDMSGKWAAMEGRNNGGLRERELLNQSPNVTPGSQARIVRLDGACVAQLDGLHPNPCDHIF